MARPRAPVRVGDIVTYRGHSWDVLGREEHGGGEATLVLGRREDGRRVVERARESQATVLGRQAPLW
jgi:hypothetical protein